MPNQTKTYSSVIPGMHYRNAPEAIEWLCGVFGFKEHAVHPGPDNTIMHAELTLGGGMIMLGSMSDKAPNRHYETTIGTGRRADPRREPNREGCK
jgi:uncharacterized glyoxalase superfamily protein PhnB